MDIMNSKKVRDYIAKLTGNYKERASLSIKGHLKIMCGDEVVFDHHNLIVDEGKGLVMDLLASLGVNYDYNPLPFNAIVLTKNTATERASDTFSSAVYRVGLNQISDEGVLHVGGAGGGQVAITHVKGSLTMTISGTISQQNGNDPSNNHINSVCLCTGVNDSYGGPGQGNYVLTNNERVFARIHVGDLVKTVDKSFNFQWLITIQ
jgi:hypothetical protein